MHKLQGRLSQMQRLDALLLQRGNSDSQVLTGYLRPGRESHHSGTATGLPTRKRSLRSGHAAVGCANCSHRFNVFLPARQSSPDSIFTAQLPTYPTPASQAALLFLEPARHILASALFPVCILPPERHVFHSITSFRSWLNLCDSHSVMSDSVTPCTVARQAPLFMEFSRQEFWSGLPFPTPGGSFQPRDSNPGLLNCRQILHHLSHQGRLSQRGSPKQLYI